MKKLAFAFRNLFEPRFPFIRPIDSSNIIAAVVLLVAAFVLMVIAACRPTAQETASRVAAARHAYVERWTACQGQPTTSPACLAMLEQEHREAIAFAAYRAEVKKQSGRRAVRKAAEAYVAEAGK